MPAQTAFKYNVLTVLRTRVPLTSGDVKIPPKTRVVVMSSPEEGKSKVKVQDPKAAPELQGLQIIAKNGAFMTTQRGRPVGTGKPKVEKVKAEPMATAEF